MRGKRYDYRAFSGDAWTLQRCSRARWRCAGVVVCVALLGVVLGYVFSGHQLALVGWLDDGQSRAKVETLNARVESLQRSLEVEQATRRALETELATMNEKAAKLRDELSFIRNAQGGR